MKDKRFDLPVQEEVEEPQRLGIAFQSGKMHGPIPRRAAHGGEHVHDEPFHAPASDRVPKGPAWIKGRWDGLECGINALQNGQEVRLDPVFHGDRDDGRLANVHVTRACSRARCPETEGACIEYLTGISLLCIQHMFK